MGYKDVRLRLGRMKPGERFFFVVDASIGGRMDRVIIINGGKIIDKKTVSQETFYEITKT